MMIERTGLVRLLVRLRFGRDVSGERHVGSGGGGIFEERMLGQEALERTCVGLPLWLLLLC